MVQHSVQTSRKRQRTARCTGNGRLVDLPPVRTKSRFGVMESGVYRVGYTGKFDGLNLYPFNDRRAPLLSLHFECNTR